MDRGRPAQSKAKINRLKRSPKAAPPPPSQPEFKTPTRLTRNRFCCPGTCESPYNDSDIQHEIIWDPTSPSPVRRGRGGRRSKAVVPVDISDIASRLAPQHGRPTATESSLQKWFGDSAIPCTPEMSQPRLKAKSTKQSAVDDLLRLAKQFDFNLNQQDEALQEERLNQSLDDDPHNELQSGVNKDHTLLDMDMDADFDLLFDEPTGSVADFSQAASGASMGTGEMVPGRPSTGGGFEDDWDNDDLLDDSLVFQMIQKPEVPSLHRSPFSNRLRSRDPGHSSSRFQGQNENVGGRRTFQLQPSPVRQVKETLRGDVPGKQQIQSTFRNEKLQSSVVETKTPLLTTTVPHLSRQLQPTTEQAGEKVGGLEGTHEIPDEDLDSLFASDLLWGDSMDDDDLLFEACEDLEKIVAVGQDAAPRVKTLKTDPKPLTSSAQMHRKTNAFPTRNMCTVPRPVANLSSPVTQLCSLSSGTVPLRIPLNRPNPQIEAPYSLTRIRNPSAVENAASRATPDQQQRARGVLQSLRPPGKVLDDRTSNRPSTTVTNKGLAVRLPAGKCSEAEIERKKQEALERRRLRMQATQTLQARNWHRS